ncbi:ammonia-forming cytochrome c nitrite reductase subunit c552 [Tessaracoccus coleopterorum]|uniref:ammonia-forming cytochrome c nitrite reductase subunit c552 n=1 Tax=Tessaracoccus coleopterorum TaxID=2714950 RepID=UPI0018D288EF|nr:ammonia-forming cytochrome c nitrite reductase subunit c552 [Tessaracoccus coleopterorum]
MRSFVCAQCHVEYYFEKETKELTFPWSKGINIDQIWEYYAEDGHKDFTHATTGAEIVKAQHPEFDIWSQGIHADNGVSCADCHMPYEAEGAKKVTNHQIQSPMLNVNASCMTCHHSTEDEMKNRVVKIQDQFIDSRDVAFDSLVQLIDALEKAQTDGTPPPRSTRPVSSRTRPASTSTTCTPRTPTASTPRLHREDHRRLAGRVAQGTARAQRGRSGDVRAVGDLPGQQAEDRGT